MAIEWRDCELSRIRDFSRKCALRFIRSKYNPSRGYLQKKGRKKKEKREEKKKKRKKKSEAASLVHANDDRSMSRLLLRAGDRTVSGQRRAHVSSGRKQTSPVS